MSFRTKGLLFHPLCWNSSTRESPPHSLQPSTGSTCVARSHPLSPRELRTSNQSCRSSSTMTFSPGWTASSRAEYSVMTIASVPSLDSSSTGTHPSRPSAALHHFQPGNSSSSRPTVTVSPRPTCIGSGYSTLYSRITRTALRDSDISLHASVCTSTESTAGRSRTIGFQLSPASAEAYTCPPVVPK